MNLEISKYLNEYIQKKFPMYYEVINKAEFMSFVNSIASNSLFKGQGKDVVLAGNMDSVIDELVDKYAQLKLTKIWQSTLYKYLSEYIERKFPMYYKAISKGELNTFINSIASNSVFKDRGLNVVLLGDTDKIIDELVERYAQLQVTSVWANFSNLCNYIKNIIVQTPDTNAEMINEKTLDDIVKKIAEGFVKDNSDYSYYMNGAYDKIFLGGYDAHYDRIKKDCYQYVKNVVVSSNVKVCYDNTTYEDLLEQVMMLVLQQYQVEEITSGLYDESIIAKFEICSREMRRRVQKHITSVINGMTLLMGIPVNEVVADITKMACETGELSASKLVNGELDQLIENYASRKRKANDSSDARRHIYQKIRVMNSANMSDEKLEKCTDEIFNILYRNHGFSLKSIECGEHDDLISNNFQRMIMEYNTVQRKNVPKRVKHNPKKRKINQILPMLLVTATLVGVVGGASYGIGELKEGIEDLSSDMRYNSITSAMSNSRYAYIYTKYTDGYNTNIQEVINDYNNYSKFGDIYGYIGFYEVYKHTNNDALAIMDSLLVDVDYKISNGNYDTKLNIDTYCFLEFAYNRLVEMGCEEVQQEKYMNAIEKYKEVKYSNVDENKTTLDCIKDKKVLELIGDIMDMYDEYSSKCYEELYGLVNGSVSLSGRTGGRV